MNFPLESESFIGEIESESERDDCCCCSGLDREDNSTSFPIFCRCENFPYFQITYKEIRLSLKKKSQIEFVKLFQNRAGNKNKSFFEKKLLESLKMKI